jgi:hypothetical protein
MSVIPSPEPHVSFITVSTTNVHGFALLLASSPYFEEESRLIKFGSGGK